jgi:hypothetical protein
MARLILTEAERDRLAALCEAAADYLYNGTEEMLRTLRESNADDFYSYSDLSERLTELEYPPQHPMRLNW